jgi:hypothetical protein
MLHGSSRTRTRSLKAMADGMEKEETSTRRDMGIRPRTFIMGGSRVQPGCRQRCIHSVMRLPSTDCAPFYNGSALLRATSVQRRRCEGLPLAAWWAFNGRCALRDFPICRDMHDASLPIRKASLSAMLPNGQIGRFATHDAATRDLGYRQVWSWTARRPKRP